MTPNERITKSKLLFYKGQKAPVHITCSNSKWHNGSIKEFREGSVVIDEEKTGETIIYFEEILNVERRRDKQ